MKVLIADDHTIFRAGIRALLDAELGIEVVAEAGTGDEAVEQVRAVRPDVVIMDLSMPGMSGLDATRRISALGYGTQVLVLTMHAEEEYLVPVIEAGGSGYLTKTSADQELIDALRIVSRGEVYLPPKATTLLLRQYRKAGEDENVQQLQTLSGREREVLTLTVEGFSAREIGERLYISPKTVDTYRSRLMEKLGLNHRSELVRFALKVGLLKDVKDLST